MISSQARKLTAVQPTVMWLRQNICGTSPTPTPSASGGGAKTSHAHQCATGKVEACESHAEFGVPASTRKWMEGMA